MRACFRPPPSSSRGKPLFSALFSRVQMTGRREVGIEVEADIHPRSAADTLGLPAAAVGDRELVVSGYDPPGLVKRTHIMLVVIG